MAGARRLSAVVRQRCPACFEGQVFRSTLAMLPACQLCGHRYEGDRDRRGHDAALATVVVLLCLVLLAAAWRWLAPDYGRPFAVLCAAFLWLMLVPGIVRYARVIRAHVSVAMLQRALR